MSEETKVHNSNNEEVVHKSTTSIATTQQQYGDSLSSLNFFDEKQLVAFKNFATEVMRSDKGGIKSVNDALAIAMRAQALNLPFGTALDHIHVISGKTGIDIHIIKALLLRGGCTWHCTKQYQPLYEYTDGINIYNDGLFPDYVKRCNTKKDADRLAAEDKDMEFCYIYPVKWYQDFNGNLYKDYQLNGNSHSIVITKQQAIEVQKSGKVPVYRVASQPIDYIYEYEFTRIVNGKEIKAISSFSYSDAVKAGFLDKDNWKKYLKVMLSHRAFTYGARDIASDIIMGCMETSELKIVTGQELNDTDFIDAEVIG